MTVSAGIIIVGPLVIAHIAGAGDITLLAITGLIMGIGLVIVIMIISDIGLITEVSTADMLRGDGIITTAIIIMDHIALDIIMGITANHLILIHQVVIK